MSEAEELHRIISTSVQHPAGSGSTRGPPASCELSCAPPRRKRKAEQSVNAPPALRHPIPITPPLRHNSVYVGCKRLIVYMVEGKGFEARPLQNPMI
jgi:hypothetical protein